MWKNWSRSYLICPARFSNLKPRSTTNFSKSTRVYSRTSLASQKAWLKLLETWLRSSARIQPHSTPPNSLQFRKPTTHKRSRQLFLCRAPNLHTPKKKRMSKYQAALTKVLPLADQAECLRSRTRRRFSQESAKQISPLDPQLINKNVMSRAAAQPRISVIRSQTRRSRSLNRLIRFSLRNTW